MPKRSLPTLTPLAQRLAGNNRRVARALDQLPTIVQQIVAAFHRGDQRSLRELSQQLVAAAVDPPTLAEVAAELAGHIELRKAKSIQRSLLALIGEVGALRSRGMVPAAELPAAKSH